MLIDKVNRNVEITRLNARNNFTKFLRHSAESNRLTHYHLELTTLFD